MSTRILQIAVVGGIIGAVISVAKALEFQERMGRLPEIRELFSLSFRDFLPE